MSDWKDEGRLPFRVRIGVTGHRPGKGHHLDQDDPRLAAVVRAQIGRVADLFAGHGTPVHLSVVSQLAEGADRIVVDQGILEARARKHEVHLEAFLPMARQDFVDAQEFDATSLAEFDRLLAGATIRHEAVGVDARTKAGRDTAYAAGGRTVVGRCDVLIGIWDGEHSGGLGGTAETLAYAASHSKPCIWIPTDPRLPARDNFAPGSAYPFFEEVTRRAGIEHENEQKIDWTPTKDQDEVLNPLASAFDSISRFNRERLDVDKEAVLHSELTSRRGVAPWVAAPFVRATVLAERWRRGFQRTAALIALLAAAAAGALAYGLSFGNESGGWAWAEAAFFLLAILGLAGARRIGFHRRWLYYRVLAERLRLAHFLAPTGAGVRRQSRLETAYTGRESATWITRAFEEVWDRRPLHPRPLMELGDDELRTLKEWLADDWIGKQIAYHDDAVIRHRRSQKILTWPLFALFIATIVFACMHALHTMEEPAIFFSIVLPAAGASLGLVLTVNQHQALSERSARMSSDLKVVRQNVLDATADSLDHMSSEAARVIDQENGAWFGSMWFLDIEHP